jgi:hypothetical protein
MALTPLRASAACSIFDYRIAEEPVLRRKKDFQKYQANHLLYRFRFQDYNCKSAIGSQRPGLSREEMEEGPGSEFEVRNDKLILAPGCEVNTFGMPGVRELRCL